MMILNKLFTPKWQHKDPAVRRRGLKQLSSEQQKIAFIEQETDRALRDDAIQLLSNDSLSELCRHKNTNINQSARVILLGRLLDNDQLPKVASDHIYIEIAALTEDAALRLAAVQQVADEDRCLELAQSHNIAKVRLAAASNIHCEQRLQQLATSSQGRDKSVYRLCKDRLAVIRAENEQKQQQQQSIEQIFDQLTSLMRNEYHTDFAGRLQIIEQQWNELKDIAQAEITDSIESAITAVRERVQQYRLELEAQRQQQQHQESVNQQRQDLLQLLTQFVDEAVQLKPDSTDSTTQWQTTAQDTLQQWRQQEQDAPVNPKQQAQFSRLEHQLSAIFSVFEQFANDESLVDLIDKVQADSISPEQAPFSRLKQLEQSIQWPAEVPLPSWYQKIKKAIKSLQQNKAVQVPKVTNIDQFQGLLADIEQALDEGQAKLANSQLRQVQSQANAQQKKMMSAQLQRLKARLQELRDWQGFATEPKQVELCQQMESLITCDKDPEQLASDIKSLQQQWKQLGGGGTDPTLWQRFQEASNQAYQPCQQYYDEQAQLRQQRVDARQQLIQQLETYEANLDWQQADWKMVQQTLSSARQSFRNQSPVDRQQHKITSNAMDTICDRIFSHIKAEYDRNLEALNELIQRAEAQRDVEDLSQAIDTIKQLQVQWKAVGITPRHADQPLWRQFRSHCDAVFSRLSQQRDERRQNIEQNIDKAEQVMATLTSELSELSISAGFERLENVQQELAELELPKNAVQSWQAQMNQLKQTLTDRRQQQQQQKHQQRWSSLLDLVQLPANVETLPAVEQLPSGFDYAELQQAYTPAKELEAGTTADIAAEETCVLLEILADIASPKEAASMRMDLQVKRLAKGIGQQESANKQRRQLIIQWLSIPNRLQCQQRFSNALMASIENEK